MSETEDSVENEAPYCWVHRDATIGYIDPTGGEPWMGGPVTIPVCTVCGREAHRKPPPPSREHLARLHALGVDYPDSGVIPPYAPAPAGDSGGERG